MKSGDKIIKIFSGNVILVYSLRAKLEEYNITSSIRNDSHDDFLGVTPAVIDLYIRQSDLEMADPVIREFIKNN